MNNKYYETLGLKPGASQKDIEFAFQTLSDQLNPENNDNHEFFKEEFRKLKEAYDILREKSILKNTNSNSNSKSKENQNYGASSDSSNSFSVTFNTDKINNLNKDFQIQNKIPQGLKISCILSMLGTGFWFLCIFILLFDTNYKINSDVGGIFTFIYIIFFGMFAAKFYGALQIYKLKKNGFIIYSVGNISFNLIILLSIVNGNQNDPLFAIAFLLLSLIFLIIFYNYKKYLIIK